MNIQQHNKNIYYQLGKRFERYLLTARTVEVTKGLKSQDRKTLETIAQHACVQGDHQSKMVDYLRILVQKARKEFNEDNKPTLDSFLEDCWAEALYNEEV